MDGFSEEARALEPHNNQWDAKISKREREVLRLIANGHSSKMVADKLCISIHTAARHRTNLLEKFQAKNTAELVFMASRRYWL
jgi:DNA-binding CsgD family transcriptional regulator